VRRPAPAALLAQASVTPSATSIRPLWIQCGGGQHGRPREPRWRAKTICSYASRSPSRKYRRSPGRAAPARGAAFRSARSRRSRSVSACTRSAPRPSVARRRYRQRRLGGASRPSADLWPSRVPRMWSHVSPWSTVLSDRDRIGSIGALSRAAVDSSATFWWLLGGCLADHAAEFDQNRSALPVHGVDMLCCERFTSDTTSLAEGGTRGQRHRVASFHRPPGVEPRRLGRLADRMLTAVRPSPHPATPGSRCPGRPGGYGRRSTVSRGSPGRCCWPASASRGSAAPGLDELIDWYGPRDRDRHRPDVARAVGAPRRTRQAKVEAASIALIST
jgi:hypothetical protein